MTKATWLGDATDPTGGPYSIKQFGETFVRGQAVDVGNLSDLQRQKLEFNPHFAFDKQNAKPVEVDEDTEAETLRTRLLSAGIKPHHNVGLAKLREMAKDLPGPAPAIDVLQQTGVSQDHASPIGTVTEVQASRLQAFEQRGE